MKYSSLASHLATALATSKLATISEAPVKVHSDEPLIQCHAVNIFATVLRVASRIVHHEAEATWGALHLVQPHHDSLYVPCLGKDLWHMYHAQGSIHPVSVTRPC